MNELNPELQQILEDIRELQEEIDYQNEIINEACAFIAEYQDKIQYLQEKLGSN